MSSHIPYSERQKWSDVVPLPQMEPADGLVPIMYSEEYSDAMSCFRAIVTENEKSARVLELTEHIIRLNPAHYTVWQYRFSTLLHLQSDLLAELSLMNEFASQNLKSYQVWHHRLTLLTHLNPDLALLKKEIAFIHESLIPDAKNYHTWSYLHWVYTRFSSLGEEMGGNRFAGKDWEAERAWCNGMLDSDGVIGKEEGDEGEDILVNGDGRNNSAWGWRWYLMVSREGVRGKTDVQAEIDYTLKQIEQIPHNASAWNYLRGLHTHFTIPFSQTFPQLEAYTSTTETRAKPVPFAIEWESDALAQTGSEEEVKRAAGLLLDLADKWDVMRRTYWRYRRNELLKQVRSSKASANVEQAEKRTATVTA